jgi:hypothetical protein
MLVSAAYAGSSSSDDDEAMAAVSVAQAVPAQIDRAMVGLVPASAIIQYNVPVELMYAPTVSGGHFFPVRNDDDSDVRFFFASEFEYRPGNSPRKENETFWAVFRFYFAFLFLAENQKDKNWGILRVGTLAFLLGIVRQNLFLTIF